MLDAAVLHRTLESIDQGVSMVDAELRVVAFNRRFLELLQFPPGRFRPGMSFEEFIRYNAERGEYGPGNVDAQVQERMQRARCFQAHHFERVRPDGTVIEVRGKPLPDGGFVTTYTDVTERKRVEAALLESESRFRDFAESAADWFWETDAEHRFTHISDGLERNTGINPETLIGRTHSEAFAGHGEDREKWEQHWRDLEARCSFGDFEFAVHPPAGGTRMVSVSGKPVFDAEGTFRGYRGAGRDVTEAHRLSAKLRHQATHDALTGLVNRGEFERRLERVLRSTVEDGGVHALCYLDLDQFKIVNDTCGHLAGDKLLRQLGALLAKTVRVRDTLARLGGDEFGILMEHCPIEQAAVVAEGVREAIEGFRFVWANQTFRLGVSIGVTPITAASRSTANVLAAADGACYLAKEHGRNRIYVYRDGDAELEHHQDQMGWIGRIQTALDENRLHLFYQPIAAVERPAEDEGMHFEVLLRMRDRGGRLVLPGAFMPAAERYHLASRLDRWVVDALIDWLEAHPRQLERLKLCWVNLSAHSLTDRGFLAYLCERVEGAAVPACKMGFEIKETAATSHASHITDLMERLKAQGCRFALDDFGTGLSSLAQLQSLAVDFVKIDGSLIRGIAEHPIDLAVVRAINEIVQALGKRSVAESVDDPAVYEKLKLEHLAVDYAQGNHVAEPRPLEELGQGGAGRDRALDSSA